MEDMGFFEVVSTQLQITNYKPDAVPREAIEKILDAATKAPSGLNTQPWNFIVLTDRHIISEVSRIYLEQWLKDQGNEPKHDEHPVYRRARHLAHHMHEVPVLIIVCVDHSRAFIRYTPGDPIVRGRYANSIWPAIQNMFLAARALGLGTRLTTTHIPREPEIKALLGIPDHVEIVVITPLGYPMGKFSPPNRHPAEEFTFHNGWGKKI